MSAKSKMLRRQTGTYFFRDKSGGGSTAIAAAIAKGATTCSVPSNTGLVAGKSFRLNDGEDIERVEIAGITGAGPYTVTFAKPTLRAHGAGAAFVEQVGYDLGHPKGAFQTSGATEQSDVTSGIQRLVLTRTLGFQKFTIQGAMHGLTLHNLAVALGIPFSRISGAGTLVSPLTMSLTGDEVATENNVCLVNTYTLQDGTIKVQEFWGVEVEPNVSIPIGFGQDGAVAMNFACYGMGVESDGALTFTADTSLRASKAKVFGDLTSVGLWIAATTNPAASTLNAAAAADAASVDLVSATGFAADDWAGLNIEDRWEAHWVGSKATNTLNLKTRLARAHAAGTAVVRLAQLPFAAISRDGVTFAARAQMTEIYNGLRRMLTAERPETVNIALTLQLLELTLANRAYVAGIPQSEIANARLALTEKLGTAAILGAYVQGVLKDGTTVCMINIWGAVPDVASIAQQLGDPNSSGVPMGLLASSGFQFLQYQ